MPAHDATLPSETPPMTAPHSAVLPPFSSLIKSRDVEDPINLWLHRPLAYGFVAATFRTPITPNMITVLAVLVGMAAGACWLYGTSTAMIAGGILLWASAILDGADGILARAKQMQSDFGRALDGTADAVVAVCTVVPAFLHLWWKDESIVHLALVVPAILSTVVHLWFYDFYKESFLTVMYGKGDGEDLEAVQRHADEAKSQGRSLIERLAMGQMLLPMMLHQNRLIRWSNPEAKDVRATKATPEMAAVFRKRNAAIMKGWTLISLAPHSYLIAICGMTDRLDLYLWIRVGLMNVIFIALLIAQRKATKTTIREWSQTPA